MRIKENSEISPTVDVQNGMSNLSIRDLKIKKNVQISSYFKKHSR